MPLTQPAMAPIDAATRFGPRGGLLLLLAAALQWFDAAPLRADVTVRVQHPANAHIDLLAWRAAIARHDAVRVVPPYACLEKPTTWGTPAASQMKLAIQLQLLAAEDGVAIDSVYAARTATDCSAEQPGTAGPLKGERVLAVYLPEFAGFGRMRTQAETNPACVASATLVVCSGNPNEAGRLGDLLWTDRP